MRTGLCWQKTLMQAKTIQQPWDDTLFLLFSYGETEDCIRFTTSIMKYGAIGKFSQFKTGEASVETCNTQLIYKMNEWDKIITRHTFNWEAIECKFDLFSHQVHPRSFRQQTIRPPQTSRMVSWKIQIAYPNQGSSKSSNYLIILKTFTRTSLGKFKS